MPEETTPTPAGDVRATDLVDALFEEAAGALCLVAPDGTVARANAEWLRSVGRGAEEVVGADALGVWPPSLDRALLERARAGAVVTIPRHARGPQGRETWWEGRAAPVRLAGGTGLLVTAREVAPKGAGLAARVLAMDRAQLRALLDQIPAGIVLSGASGRIIVGNAEMERIFGHPILFSEDLSAYGEWKGFHPDGRPIAPHEWPLARSLTTGEVVTREEIAIEGAGGARVAVSVSSAPIRGRGGAIEAGLAVAWDVTERTRLEASLRESASELQAVLDAVPVAVFITRDRDARGMVGNHASNELLRLPPGANLSKSAPPGAAPAHFRVLHEGVETPAAELPMQRAAARGVEVRDYEFDLVFDDGAVRHLLGNAAPLADGRGGTRGAVGAFLDITERKAAAEAARRSEATLDAFFDASPGILNLVDEELRYLKTDPGTPTNFGLDRAGIVGRRLVDLAPGFVDEFGPMLRRVLSTGRAELAVETHHAVPGRPLERTYWRSSYFPVPLAGGGRGLGVIGLEITDLKAAEAAVRRNEAVLAQAGQMAHLGAWWIEIADPSNLAASPLFWSDEVYRIFGYAPGEVAVTNALFFERVPPEDHARITEAVARSLTERRPYSLEHGVVRPDGSERVVLEHAEVSFDDSGRPVRIVGAVLDVTEQKRVERALREADRQKDEFLAVLAHELRNPLSAIASATHVIRARVTQGQDVRRPLEILERQTRNSARLLDDLLDISRITRGLVHLRREEVRLDAVVAGAVDSQRALLDAAHHDLSITLPHDPVVVEGDPTRLEQIVANLVNNAAKYTPDGGRIQVVVEPHGDEVLVRVRDDGAGISADLLSRIFHPFVQGEQTLARSKGGLGLGLALVRRLVELHGGSIEARSEGAGRGSEFVVRLPGARRAAAPAAERIASGPPRRHRILLVEDNRDAAELLAEYLRSAGHEVEVAHDGPAALAAAARGPREVVLLDIGLPGMDGYEVARRLREGGEGASAPVLIALTGYGHEEDRRRAREAGFAHHLTKPVEPDALERLLARIGGAGV